MMHQSKSRSFMKNFFMSKTLISTTSKDRITRVLMSVFVCSITVIMATTAPLSVAWGLSPTESEQPGSEQPALANDLVLENIVLDKSIDGFSINILTSGPIPDYHLSAFTKPSRMVVDLVGKWKNKGKTVYKFNHNVIEKIRVGKHKEKMRIVMDLSGKRTLSPVIMEKSNGLSLVSSKSKRTMHSLAKSDLPKSASTSISGDRKILKSVRYRASEGEIAFTLATDEPVGTFKSEIIKDETPVKLVLDIDGKWDYPGNTVFHVTSDLVQKVRIGEHADFMRIVFDLIDADSPTHLIEDSSDGLVISLRRESL
ncbi:AMIN domain-containing protein [Desulfobacterales bacterium HSG16]|nr:AMIN domain-containing protein [Desulfobacterales bacterium HSG16]